MIFHSKIEKPSLIFMTDHYVFILWFLLSPRLISAVADWMSTILSHMVWHCGLSANLRCRSEHAARDRWKYKTQKIAKNRHLGTVAQLCRAISSQIRHISTIEKPVKQQYVLQTSPWYDELRPTSGWDRFGSLGHLYEFQRVSRLGSVTAR